jgi:Xaa-Pro aminopeptidase
MDIEKIQSFLQQHDLDGWLLADFHGRNAVAVELLGLTGLVTRRSFYYIPTLGEPVGLVHAIEKDKFTGLPGSIVTYSGYRVLEKELSRILADSSRIAMEYSPRGRLPYIDLVDAGTIELIRDIGVEIVSSENLVALFQAALSVEQIATHRMAARNLIEIKDRVFAHIREKLDAGGSLTEHQVVDFMLEQFREYDMVTRSRPICAIDANAGNPHYEPPATGGAEIRRGQLILIDLWAKLDRADAVYGDITWMAFAGRREEIPDKYVELFDVISRARDAAVDHVRRNIEKKPVRGAEVDDICRGVIEKAGYGKYFTHRTGHSITTSEHGPGPNIDNLETEDGRKLRRGHLFSIEPGIYMEDCGLRTEIDMLINYDGAEVTTLPLQTEIVALW